MNKNNILHLSIPEIDKNDIKYVNNCLESLFFSTASNYVDKFENEFKKFIKSKNAIAICNGTSALHLSLLSLDIKNNDKVLVSDSTFIASVNPIKYVGAEPIFVDSEKQTWNIDTEFLYDHIKKLIKKNKKPKAIILAHILGNPCDIFPIYDICMKNDIFIIEDAAEALGAYYLQDEFKNKYAGTIGHIGCYSFNGNKLITTGGGGMIVTDNDKIAKRIRHISRQAKKYKIQYIHDEIGYNYRMIGLSAALGLSQLEKINKILEKKNNIANYYNKNFKNIKGLIVYPNNSNWYISSNWLYSILIDKKISKKKNILELIEYLSNENIIARPLWYPIRKMKMYKNYKAISRNNNFFSDYLYESGISLPCFSNINKKQQDKVISIIKDNIKI